MIKNALILTCLLVALGSCKKEKTKTKDKLEGTWVAVSMTATEFDGSSLDLIAAGESMKMTFDNCSDDIACPVVTELSLDGDIESFNSLYTITEDGTQMGIAYTFEETITIESLTETSLSIYTPEFVYGTDFYATLEKQ